MNTTRLLTTIFTAAIVASPAVNAAENATLFLDTQGKLIIPHVLVGNEVYYVQMDRIGDSDDFDLNEATLINITPQPGDDWATTEELVGVWSPEGMADTVLTLEADGTYSVTVPAGNGCNAGVETGTWAINATTGVFTSYALTDDNGYCGLSHPTGLVRVELEGTDLLATIYSVSSEGQPVSTEVTLLAN